MSLDWPLPWTSEDIASLARRMIDDQVETAKVDFKVSISSSMSAAEKVELAKDVCALANTDSDHHSGFGFLILGARRGELVGGVSCLAAEAADHTSSTLSKIVSEYVAPVPVLRLLVFNESTKGDWGVLLVAPSVEQPHIFVREYSGNPKRGDWFIRVNDTTQPAGPSDYVRILTKQTRRAVDGYERHIQDLTLRLAKLETESSLASVLPRLLATGRPTEDDHPTPIADDDAALHTRIRRTLSSPETMLEDELIGMAAHLQATIEDDSPDCPWALAQLTQANAETYLNFLEAKTKPFALAVAAALRYDRDERLAGGIVKAISLLGVEPEPVPGRAYNDRGRQVRAYPLALVVYSTVLMSLYERRCAALAGVAKLRLSSREHERADPLLDLMLNVLWSDDVFNAAANTQNAVAFANRIVPVLGSWLGEFLPVRDFRSFMYVTEFVTGLAFMNAAQPRRGPAAPFPGKYLYDSDARQAIGGWLGATQEWLQPVLGSPNVAFKRFDETASGVIDRRVAFGGRGFVSGAEKAYATALANQR